MRKAIYELNIKQIILQHFLVIAVGLLIFYIDKIEFLDKFFPKLFLLVVAVSKSVYFVGHSFNKIEEASEKNHSYNKFLLVIITNIFLVIVSFTVDHTCLISLDDKAYKGLIVTNTLYDVMADFFYFSVLTFTTTGFGDIIPITKTAKALVTMEVMVAFITTIIVISNFVHIKDSIHDLSFIKIQKRLNRKKTQGKRSESEELVDE
jgi:hypothetical protein